MMNWRMGKLRVDVVMVVDGRAFRDALPKSFNIELRDIMMFRCIILWVKE